MPSDPRQDNRETNEERASRRVRASFRVALAFGLVAATIELGIILWMARC